MDFFENQLQINRLIIIEFLKMLSCIENDIQFYKDYPFDKSNIKIQKLESKKKKYWRLFIFSTKQEDYINSFYFFNFPKLKNDFMNAIRSFPLLHHQKSFFLRLSRSSEHCLHLSERLNHHHQMYLWNEQK